MSKLKEINLWIIYFIITFITICISCLAFYNEWKSNKEKFVEEITNINRITAQNTLSAFRKQESILKILGKNLLTNDAYNYPEEARITINEMIEVNKGLVAFGLAQYNGQLLIVSNIPEGVKLPNLMENPKSKVSFEIARESDKMMLGRTYKLKASNSWGMPIRMSIKNRHGETPLVMTAGIKVDGGDTPLNVKEVPDNALIQLLRSDGYLQFQNSIDKKDYSNTYDKAFDKKLFTQIKNYNKSGITIFDSQILEKATLSSILYIKEYDLYSIVSLPYSKINKSLYTKASVFVVLFLIIQAVLYFVFKYTIRIQTSMNSYLKHLARHDTLTNLPNRLALQEELEKRISNKESFYLLFLDLDNFKYINDTYGHNFGDELLKVISNRLKKLILKTDYISRQGGDEFILIIKEKQKEPIRNIANALLETVSSQITINNNEIFTGTSIGIIKQDNKNDSVTDLLNKADIALYKAKESKNTYVFFTEELYKNSKQFIQIETQLRYAIKNNEFHVVYQPKIDSKTLKVIGVEALLRWENKLLGFISPEIFISIAEKSGLINEIGEYVINTAQADIKDVWKKTNTKFSLSVNLSPRQLSSQKNIKRLKKLIKSENFDNKYFILEVTENIFIQETQKTITILEEFRANNIGISLDDFGTGYSSLSILSKLPLSELKIDKSFIQNMLLEEENLMLVKSIINIGKDMHLNIVAEGVETKEELNILTKLGCEIYQGYYFSKPLVKEDLITYINSKNK